MGSTASRHTDTMASVSSSKIFTQTVMSLPDKVFFALTSTNNEEAAIAVVADLDLPPSFPGGSTGRYARIDRCGCISSNRSCAVSG